MQSSEHKPTKKIRIEIDGEDYEVEDREQTPRELLQIVGLDPSTTYLIELQGNHQESFKDTPDAPIKLHNNMRFITADIGSAPVA